jgi:hypothetical protein
MTDSRFSIPIDNIILDNEIYPRSTIDHKRVGLFAENLRDGLITACLEAYIEDVVKEALDFLVRRCDDPDRIPNKVRTTAFDPLRHSDDPMKVWEIAGAGWKKVLTDNKDRCIKKFIGQFNTPNPENIDELIHNVLGFRKISSKWKWRGISKESSRNKLIGYIEIRGAIAHRTKHMKNVTKAMAEDYLQFVERIVKITDECLQEHINNITDELPWELE